MTNCFLRISGWLSLSVIAVGGATAVQVSYRIVAYMDQYNQPAGFVEGSPGVYYGISGSATTVGFSITPQGLMTILASFPSGHNVESLFVAGSNGRLYSSVELSDDPANMFSVTSVPGSAQFYPEPDFVPELTQSLSDGSLLGVGPANTASNAWNLLICGLDGKITSLYEFPSNERLPASAIYASDGNYYGIAQDMDAPTGYVYRVTPSGVITTL